MKNKLLIILFGSLTTGVTFTVVGLWQLNAAPISYPGQAFLYFLLNWFLASCYWLVFGSIGYFVISYFNLNNLKSYLLCSIACSLPAAIFTLNSSEFAYVFSSLLSGVLSCLVIIIFSNKAHNKSLNKDARYSRTC